MLLPNFSIVTGDKRSDYLRDLATRAINSGKYVLFDCLGNYTQSALKLKIENNGYDTVVMGEAGTAGIWQVKQLAQQLPGVKFFVAK